MLGFTNTIGTLIQELRAKEVELSRSFRKLLQVRILVGKCQFISY
jgi:hypothetical protein